MELKQVTKSIENNGASYDKSAESKENYLQLAGEGQKESWLKTRYIAIFMGFMADFFLYFYRSTVSVSIVAMVSNSHASNETDVLVSKSCLNLIEMNDTQKTSQFMEGEFSWSPEIQGYILGTSFICYTIAMPIFSKVAETYGCKKILFFCILFSSLFTFLSPFAARWNVYAFIVVQTLRGISQAGTFPAKAILIANWCPKQERGFLYTLSVCGIPLGVVVGSYLSGVLCDSAILGGWPSAFFVNGSIGFLGSAVVWFFLYDNPSVHPRISPVELEYILKNQENVLREKRPKTPWKSILTSVPVYALAYAQFGEVWALGHFLTVNPTFLKTILHYSVEQDGLFNALPFLLQIFVSQIGGILSKLFINRKWFTVDKTRKFWTILSTFGYSLCVLGIYFAGCNRTPVLILSISAMSFLAFSFSGSCITFPDMSPTFAGSICGITSSIGSIAHFLVPLTVGYLTENSQIIEQWRKMFLVSIGVVCSSGLVFAIFGSAKIQPWNEVYEENQKRKKENKKNNVQN